jgi:hypothetical protein
MDIYTLPARHSGKSGLTSSKSAWPPIRERAGGGREDKCAELSDGASDGELGGTLARWILRSQNMSSVLIVNGDVPPRKMYQNTLVRECPLSRPNALKFNSLLRDVPKLGRKCGEMYQKMFFAQYSPHTK